ncbi:flagellar hook capping FlgD N-terminal domain-containing protein [Romboutsia sp.]|uniref:flagellar hook capping FlgD N-terminal domain-containing protein n=1 Tax=Romboutsia sp. TaxID=1965302 RepID=UPI003F380463
MNNLTAVNNNVSNYNTRTYDKTENGTDIILPGQETSKDIFLKMLVAQMTNQDPFNPQDPTQYVTQLAQFNSLEQMMNLNTSMEYLLGATNGLLVNSAMGAASNLIGKNVEVYVPKEEAGEDYGKKTYTGKVESVHIKDGVVYMNVRIDETGELKSIEYGALVKVSDEKIDTGGETKPEENPDVDTENKGE